ncbi:Outer membrane protein (porin) [Formivibrio citricus]|uniref:Outer membrane protein (Porin) n=1 Tax=Formivibrio citricus TaxID=83765 RepID=A0A1I5E1T5_9NEIS|nr:porin [Formivibrio citricus]SFO05121.1 Outer membrane protein (porin) [Formivibrio citricus]
MKKVLSIAVAAAFVAPAAMAEVTVYGSLRTGIEYSKVTDNGADNDITRARLVDYDSRIGFKGSDKLDNGMKLQWQVENAVKVGNGSTTPGWNSKGAWIALRHQYGDVLVGSYYDLSAQLLTAVLDYDVVTPGLTWWQGLGNSVEGYVTTMNTKHSLGVARDVYSGSPALNNAITYITPDINGFKGKVLYDFGAKTAAVNNNGMQASLTYRSKLFNVGGAYKLVNDSYQSGNATTLNAEDYYKNYSVGANIQPVAGWNISALWNRAKVRKSSNEVWQDGWAIGTSYRTGKHGVGLHYGRVGDYTKNGSKTSDTGGYALGAQYSYKLSKQTMMAAALGLNRNDKYSAMILPAATSFNEGGAVPVNYGAKIMEATVSIRTDF